MVRRTTILARIAQLAAGSLRIEDAKDAWPGIVTIDLPNEQRRFALHVGPIGGSHRGRDHRERRFQNPEKRTPIESDPSALPLLVGLWEEGNQPILVAFSPIHRIGRETRFSLFVPLALLQRAAITGWAEHTSTSEETIIAFRPDLLPVYAATQVQGIGISPSVITHSQSALMSTGESTEAQAERKRIAYTAAFRDARFTKAVIEAYEGLCAMCGLNLGLCEAAHIHPVGAPGSADAIWNGMALCANHHVAFDRHAIWVNPQSHELRIHPRLREQSTRTNACIDFLRGTFPQLRKPSVEDATPRPDMFEKRYEFFEDEYRWASGAAET